jgi:hypothetical protein
MENPQTTDDDLFDIKLSHTGKYYIRKFIIVARVVSIAGIVFSVLNLISTAIQTSNANLSNFKDFKFLLLQMQILPFYTGVQCLLVLIQLWYYWKLTKWLKKSLDYNDERIFNEAFRVLYRYSIPGMVFCILALLMAVLDLMSVIQLYLR